MAKHLLGELLLNDGVIHERDLQEALALQNKEGGLLGMILLNSGFITELELKRALDIQAVETLN